MPDLLTIGHSTHALERFAELLRAHEVALVADVRLHPGSRRMPHFSRTELERSLPELGFGYEHLAALGGRRRARPDTPNSGWDQPAFRGYADHMATPEFAAGLEQLEQLARERRTAVMCAEGLWWRCHRRLIADALTARGWRVLHILPDAKLAEHALTPFALVAEGGRLTYPPAQGALNVW